MRLVDSTNNGFTRKYLAFELDGASGDTFGQNLHVSDPARPGGLEPPTSGFGDLRSTN